VGEKTKQILVLLGSLGRHLTLLVRGVLFHAYILARSCRGHLKTVMIIITTTLRSLCHWRNHDSRGNHTHKPIAMHIITNANYYQAFGES